MWPDVYVQELYERCDKLRRTAFKLATEAEDNDSSLGNDAPLYSEQITYKYLFNPLTLALSILILFNLICLWCFFLFI